MTTDRTVPIYEVFETEIDPAMNQKFFGRQAHAETYQKQLQKSLGAEVTVTLKEHRIPINREGICNALNNLPKR